MGTYFEAGIGRSFRGQGIDMGRRAASQALSQLEKYRPSLAIVFACPELDLDAIQKGILETIGDCPLIGTSTAGEIANGLITRGVVVTVIASPHLKVSVGMGTGVSKNFENAVNEALAQAKASKYFNPTHPLHQMLHISTSKRPRVSPVLAIMFSAGATKSRFCLTHDIHTMLRKGSANRIPIFGGSSGDYFRFEATYQMANQHLSNDSVVLAFIESDILFGLGMAHGFSPTTKRALITKASGHIVYELDNRPAADVCSELLGVPRGQLGNDAIWFSRYPFGTTDLYGNSILQVPEQVLDDGSIKFGPIMKTDQVITLMNGTKDDMRDAGLSAYNKAILQGGLKKPALALMFSCALRMRLMGKDRRSEINSVLRKTKVPVAGFYTFGEQGITDDCLPIYANQSVSTLVFSDELNPVATMIHKGKDIYFTFASQLNRKISQIKAITRINQILEDQTVVESLLAMLSKELPMVLQWADGAFYFPSKTAGTYILMGASDRRKFPEKIIPHETGSHYTCIGLDIHCKHFGLMVLKQKDNELVPDDEDMLFAETVAKLVAGSLHKIDLDRGLEAKMQHFEIFNQLGKELSHSIATTVQFQKLVEHIRCILKFSFVSLWLVDPTHQILVKEAVDADPDVIFTGDKRENDERITKWQLTHCQLLSVADTEDKSNPVNLLHPFPFQFISLPVFYKGALRGILNVYSFIKSNSFFEHVRLYDDENVGFLESLAAHISVLIGNRFIQKDTTLFKEINHRVKNNLQNIASLLRMQIRRLDRVSPEQALSDSISRIMSIAVVHENLSHGEIGMVNVGQLIASISQFSVTGNSEEPIITLDISGVPIMIPSKEATSLALVVNELIQNALRHGILPQGRGKLSITISQTNGFISVIVHNDGPGISSDFDIEKRSNLGLTIVRTLVQNELKGSFTLVNSEGTVATVTFPFPETYVHA
ncbi:MAG: FIST N-terminal domain-containing protein [Syntrophorhabdus sp.]